MSLGNMGISARVRVSPIGFIIIGLCVLAIIHYFATNGSWSARHSDSGESVSIKQLLATAIDLAQNGGDAVRKVKKNNDLEKKSKGQTKEGVDDPVTQGDLLSHRAIFYGFEKLFPNVKVVSEEHENTSFDTSNVKTATTSAAMLNKHLHNLEDDYEPIKDVLIWIDPLDATKEYTENLLNFVTTMVCIVVNGKPVAGIIHSPFLEQTSWAWLGHGNSPDLDIKDSKVSETSPKIVVSLSHAGKADATIKEAFGSSAQVLKAGGAGYKVLSVINGVADAYVHLTIIKKWDVCAGDAILRAIGGEMTMLNGEHINYASGKDFINKKGILATVHKHYNFLEKLNKVH